MRTSTSETLYHAVMRQLAAALWDEGRGVPAMELLLSMVERPRPPLVIPPLRPPYPTVVHSGHGGTLWE